MKLARILHEVYCKPWLITPEMHKQIADIVQAHIDGSAHVAGGIAEAFEIQEKEILSYYQNVAVIDVAGVIGRKVSAIEKSSGVTDVNDIADALMAVEGADGIVMRFDTPGGTVTGVPELAMLIREVGQEIPIVGFVDGDACSAGYWLAAQTHAICGGVSSEVGSIGVYMALLDSSRAAEMQGLKVEVVKAGRYKGIGIPGTPLTDDQKAHLQAEVDKVYEMFKGSVQIGRGKIADEVMQGQTFMGQDAIAAGLMDEIGGLDKAVELVGLI